MPHSDDASAKMSASARGILFRTNANDTPLFRVRIFRHTRKHILSIVERTTMSFFCSPTVLSIPSIRGHREGGSEGPKSPATVSSVVLQDGDVVISNGIVDMDFV